ncbi:uncharacterized protein LAESUDRAFT_730883 [Laetiporus sulphureus 93-53]|uniref:Uncharacterized protein n=1 Tax=Laetiporus sulphureus 93-53 TaxID=1314785 RepID=A0A165BWW7_9APHY|nr:uncharacterized protein LAESUDRAFT_730883 [Laetiporus sulphureus 93-53]KZT01800.1 hypothetical protein LAESUDRAFT_730883 [Laetiporus sulphureus 93-53]
MNFAADSTFDHSGGSRIDNPFGKPEKPAEGEHSSSIGYPQDYAEEKRYCLNVRGMIVRLTL